MMVEEMTFGMIVFSFVLHHVIFRALPGRDDDACRAKSCYISHFHCTITIVSSVAYWIVNPVHLTSPEFMVNGPTGSQSEWMRLTVWLILILFDVFPLLSCDAGCIFYRILRE
jgi:hypothetical protein